MLFATNTVWCCLRRYYGRPTRIRWNDQRSWRSYRGTARISWGRRKREILEQDFEHRKRIIEQEQKFRQDIIEKEKLQQKQSILEMKKLKDKKKAEKLKNITASDIGNRMTKLLGHIENQNANLAITISSSDDDSPNGSETIESDITSVAENVVIDVADISNNSVSVLKQFISRIETTRK